MNRKYRSEDEYDVQLADKALKEYEKNPKTYTYEEIVRELNLEELNNQTKKNAKKNKNAKELRKDLKV